MQKNLCLKVIVILFCFFAVSSVDAQECSTKELNTLKQLASNIKLNYELEDDTYNESHKYNFLISTVNFNDSFYLVDMDGHTFRYVSNLEKDGIRGLRSVDEGITYKINVYASNKTNCVGTKIVTKKIEIPYYNDYSQREECIGIEEFSLCQKYYSGYIESEEYFLEKVNEYKNRNNNPTIVEKSNFFGMIIKFISNNLIFVIPVAIILVGITVIVIIKVIKSKKRTKVRI